MSKKSEFLSFVRALTILKKIEVWDASHIYQNAWDVDESFIPENVPRAAAELVFWRYTGGQKPGWLVEADDAK